MGWKSIRLFLFIIEINFLDALLFKAALILSFWSNYKIRNFYSLMGMISYGVTTHELLVMSVK